MRVEGVGLRVEPRVQVFHGLCQLPHQLFHLPNVNLCHEVDRNRFFHLQNVNFSHHVDRNRFLRFELPGTPFRV